MVGRAMINCPSAFSKTLKFEKIFKNHESNISQKLPEPNMWLLVNHTKPKRHFVLKLVYFNSGQLPISEHAVTK